MSASTACRGANCKLRSFFFAHFRFGPWHGVPKVDVDDMDVHGFGMIGVPKVVVDDTFETGDAGAVIGDRGEYSGDAGEYPTPG